MLGVGGIVGSIVWLDNEKIRRQINGARLNKIDDLSKTINFMKEDLRAMLTRINDLERNIMKIKLSKKSMID
jgi:DNA mismatch repair ATPase MutS